MTDTAVIEGATAHRPWPMPAGSWIMFQSWRGLLFAHWPVAIRDLRRLVPPQLMLEEFDGSAWVGLTPFRLADLRARCLPVIPGVSEFPEMNLRTYVRVRDRPGVFFFSLDAANRVAVAGARSVYRLPYRHASMRIESRDDWVHYRSRRSGEDAEFRGRYRPTGAIFQPEPGTLEHFLTERYALYTVLRAGRILRGEIHHRPWSLQAAEVDVERNTVPSAHGIPISGPPRVAHFAGRQDVLIWPPKRVRNQRGSGA